MTDGTAAMTTERALALRWSNFEAPAGEMPPAARTPDGAVIYAIGDIHGRCDLLTAIHRGIALDAGQRPAHRRVVIYLGDYISRGVDSSRVLEQVIAWRPEGFQIVTLKGNHEELLLRFLDDDLNAGRHWLEFGGLATLRQYGIDAGASADDEHTLRVLRQRLLAALPATHIQFLRTLAIRHREGGYLFVHAGVLPGVALDAQSDRDLVWIRNRFLASEHDHGAVVVHGHCVSAEPQVRHNRIGIDTGAYDTGVLTCLVLAGAQRSFLQTSDCPAQPPSDTAAALVRADADCANSPAHVRGRRAERCALVQAADCANTTRSGAPGVLKSRETN